MHLPDAVDIVEVAPRDGLQDAVTLTTAVKVRFLELLVAAGFRRLEFTSFAHPSWIPPLADADELARLRPVARGVRWSALVPNLRGYQRAEAAGVDEIVTVVSASDAHNRANLNRSNEESLAGAVEILARAQEAGIRRRCAIATAFGCPFQGDVPASQVVRVARAYAAAGADEIVLADTIGVAQPRQVVQLVDAVREAVPETIALALHLHDRHGFALANALAGMQAGIRIFDAAASGLGGCPYAPGAPGNVTTEALVAFCQAMGIATGIDRNALAKAAEFVQMQLAQARAAGADAS